MFHFYWFTSQVALTLGLGPVQARSLEHCLGLPWGSGHTSTCPSFSTSLGVLAGIGSKAQWLEHKPVLTWDADIACCRQTHYTRMPALKANAAKLSKNTILCGGLHLKAETFLKMYFGFIWEPELDRRRDRENFPWWFTLLMTKTTMPVPS